MKLQPKQAVVATLSLKNLYPLSDKKQVCMLSNSNIQNLVILGRSFSATKNGLCLSVLLAPKTDTQLMSFLGFANYYREFIKGYADEVGEEIRMKRKT